MHPKPKSDYRQSNFSFPQKGLWERFPEPDRVRCRELLTQLLRFVVVNTSTSQKGNERQD
jgi:hypothetical protein